MYNASRHLRECLDSILTQTCADFELLIVDDGSDDDSVSIVRSYADPRIRLVERAHDYVATLNCLLDEARGRYIARMDADDLMKPDRLRVQFEYMEAHPEVDILGSEVDYVGQPAAASFPVEELQAVPVCLEDLLDGNVVAHPTVMMRRDSLRTHGLHYEAAYIYAEDYRLWAEALRAGLHVANLPCRLLDYRLSDKQVSAVHREEQARHAAQVQEQIAACLYRMPFENTASLALLKDKILSPLPGNRLTVIIPFLNEREEVANTLQSLRTHVGDAVEVLVINDGSDDGFDYASAVAPYRVSYVAHARRRGVAANRDLGVALCRTPYFLLLDAHMRFYDSAWPARLVSLLDADDRVLLCCQSRVLGYDEEGRVVPRPECPDSFGAVSAFRRDQYWPDIEWNSREHSPGQQVEPIAHVLGAAYAASCRYWQHLKGLQGLRKYGCDEAYISFKVWREGGRCLLVKDVVIGHLYRSEAPYRHYEAEGVSNYLLVSRLTFSRPWYCLASAVALRKNRALYAKALRILQANRADIEALQAYLRSIYTRSFEEVLRLHREFLWQDHRPDASLLRQADQVVRAHPATALGLYDGKLGQLIWHCQYARWQGQEPSPGLVEPLWADIGEAVRLRRLSWNFAQGLAGVGWGMLYLYTRGFLDAYPDRLLHEVDRQLAEVALPRVSATAFAEGAGGVLAYAVLRMQTGRPSWPDSFRSELEEVAAGIIASPRSDLPSLYYALFFQDLCRHGIVPEGYVPRVSEWRSYEVRLPRNPAYWTAGLHDGCIGAFINLIDNPNKQVNKICP